MFHRQMQLLSSQRCSITKSSSRQNGFTLVELLVVLVIVIAIAALLWVAIGAMFGVFENMSCKSNMKELGKAIKLYATNHKEYYPVGNMPKKYWTFQSYILESLDENELANNINRKRKSKKSKDCFDANKDTEDEKSAASMNLDVMICPSSRKSGEIWEDPTGRWGNYATTNYFGVMGTTASSQDGMLYSHKRGVKAKSGKVPDGNAKTLLLGERANVGDLEYGWWACGAGKATQGIGRTGEGDNLLSTEIGITEGGDEHEHRFHFWSDHSGGQVNFVFVDGHAVSFSYNLDYNVLQKIATRKGKEVVTADQLE